MTTADVHPLDTFIVVTTTLSSRDEALQLAESMVDQHLAACVHVTGPVSSSYRWKGKVEVDEEWTCQAKTRASWFDRVAEFITANHRYEVPEIVATKLEKISGPYARWLNEQLPLSGDTVTRSKTSGSGP